MPEYKWALGNGEIVSADYNRANDTISNDQVKQELLESFLQFGHEVTCETVSDQLLEVYKVSIAGQQDITICAKGTTPGGRANLNDEQRTQQKSKYINYTYQQQEAGNRAIQLGVYKRDNQIIFCAWKLKSSTSDAETPISKQIKITTIAKAMKEGFVQQDKGGGELACAFRKEFIYFYINNCYWLHTGQVTELADRTAPEEESETTNVDLIYQTELQSDFSHNRIIFGAPGTGKSYRINKEKDELIANGGEFERVTFHPDYYYANFVGTYKPTMVDVVKNRIVGADESEVLSVLLDNTKTAQEKYDLLYDKFKEDSLTRLPVLLGLYTDESFKTLKKDGTDAVGDNSVERNHGRAIRPYVSLINENCSTSEIAYEYVPGPFMRTLVKALKNANSDNPVPHLLIVEEINRANMAAVFGDVFQLLDRDDNEVSEYPIQASEDMKKYLAKELGGNPQDYSEIKLPNNMFIWATMNSADQGVFPMDTAFKRRWDFTYIGIDENQEGVQGKKVRLGKGSYEREVEWNKLRMEINRELLKYKVNEDKLMGPYFIAKKTLGSSEIIDADTFIKVFKNKVIMYLFDDAAKQKRPSLFAGCEEKNLYSDICSEFDKKGVYIFTDDISKEFNDKPGDE